MAGVLPSNALVASGLTFAYTTREPLLDDISFSVSPGLYRVAGQNGSGKTTLLRILATALPAPPKAVHLDGLDLSSPRSRREARQSIALLPQTTRADSRLRVRDWLELGAWLQRVDGEERKRQLKAAAEYWDLDALLGKRVNRLSVGQRRRVDLASACLRTRVKLVVLDEPFAALDPLNVDLCKRKVLELAEESIVIFSDPAVSDWGEPELLVNLGH